MAKHILKQLPLGGTTFLTYPFKRNTLKGSISFLMESITSLPVPNHGNAIPQKIASND